MKKMVLVVLILTVSAPAQMSPAAIENMTKNIDDGITKLACQNTLRGYTIQFYQTYAMAVKYGQMRRASMLISGAEELNRRSNDVNPGSCTGDNAKNLNEYVTSLIKKVESVK